MSGFRHLQILLDLQQEPDRLGLSADGEKLFFE